MGLAGRRITVVGVESQYQQVAFRFCPVALNGLRIIRSVAVAPAGKTSAMPCRQCPAVP